MERVRPKKTALFERDFSDALIFTANSLKAGLNLVQAIELVSQETDGPVSNEFRAVVSDVALGRTLEDALSAMAGRVPLPDVAIFVEAVLILRETGGDLVETFESLVSTIRERNLVAGRIRSLTSQTIFQGIVISLIPVAMCVVFLIVSPDFIMPLFVTAPGLGLLTVALILLLLGGLLMKKISQVKI